MFFGHIKQLDDAEKIYPKAVVTLLKIFAKLDTKTLENKRYDVDGDNIFYSVVEAETAPAANNKPETHKKYIDVQFLLEGEEGIGVIIDQGQHPVTEDYYAEKDLAFYSKDLKDELMVEAKSGNFTVLFPKDIHRPLCAVKSSGKIRKIVGKIAMSAL